MEEKKSRSQVVTILKALSRNRMAVFGIVGRITLVFGWIIPQFIAPAEFGNQKLAGAL